MMQKTEPTSITAQEPGWLSEAVREYETDADFVAESLAIGLIERALELMEEQGMSRSALADAMEVSRAHVTRLFNAPPNLTLRSIAKLSLALGVEPYVSLGAPQRLPTRPRCKTAS
jgi:antitoxin component HigA of HigAB toxin-antitoxin module